MKLNRELEECLDKQFPKGDPARGKALVLHSLAQIKINKIFEEIDISIGLTKSEVPVVIEQSKFLKELKKVKEKYLDVID